jgi:hypothetical protein
VIFLLTNKIPFPRNYERFIELGHKAVQENNLLEALNFFEKAYTIIPDFSLNYFIVTLHLELGHHKRALEVASEMKEQYYSHWDYRELYIQILIKNNKFTQAHSIINEQILSEQEENTNKLSSLRKKFRYVKLMHQQFEPKDNKEVRADLLRLGEYDYCEQFSIVKKVVQLPQEEFIDIGKHILLNNELHNLVRSWVLEEFSSCHYQETLEYLWWDQQKYTIIPATIGNPLDCAAYQRIRLFLEKELLNEDLFLLVEILEELRLHFALLYPMADQVIKNPTLWAISYIIFSKPAAAYKYQLYNQWRELKEIQKIQGELHTDIESFLS